MSRFNLLMAYDQLGPAQEESFQHQAFISGPISHIGVAAHRFRYSPFSRGSRQGLNPKTRQVYFPLYFTLFPDIFSSLVASGLGRRDPGSQPDFVLQRRSDCSTQDLQWETCLVHLDLGIPECDRGLRNLCRKINGKMFLGICFCMESVLTKLLFELE